MLLAESRNKLENSISLTESSFQIVPADFTQLFTEALTHHIIPRVAQHGANFAWVTHWLIVHKELNLTVGGIGSRGLPDENGQVVIGYFMDCKFENQGVATEAVSRFVDWLFANPDVKMVTAYTPTEHVRSQRVLQKNGFVGAGQVAEGLSWQRLR